MGGKGKFFRQVSTPSNEVPVLKGGAFSRPGEKKRLIALRERRRKAHERKELESCGESLNNIQMGGRT